MKAISENPPRKVWADVGRIVAIFGVVLIHACGVTFYQFGKIPEGAWLSASFLDSLARCAIPVFVMLSGALLLKRDAPPATLHRVFQRVIRVAIPLLVWNAAYLLYVSGYSVRSIDWLSMLRVPPMYHLWFVYMIIGLYLLLPVFQVIFQLLVNRRDLQFYFLVLWFIVTCVPIYQPLPLLDLMQQTSLLGYGGYFLMGGVIAASEGFQKRSMPRWVAIYFCAVAVTFWLTWSLSARAHSAVEVAYLYFSPNVFVAALAAFVVISRLRMEAMSARAKSIIHRISDLSFLVFFMHVVILERVRSQVVSLKMAMPMLLQILTIAALTFIICLVIAAVLRLLPKSREILG